MKRVLSRSALVWGALLVAAAGPAAASDWPHFGGDAQLTNAVASTSAPDFTASAAASLQIRWSAHLDGSVIASPLYAEGVVVGGKVESVVYAATQAGSVVALDATSGSVLWQRPLGTATTTCDEDQAGSTGAYGISSTGVIDRSRNALYVVGATGLLYALDLSTGETVPGWPVRITQDPTGEYVWGGLTLAGNRLYVPVASYCDVPGTSGQYATGRLVAVDVGSASIVSTFQVSPGVGELGSIWGWGGASVDPATGDLWTATGNSWTYDPGCGCISQTSGYGESVVELDPNLNVVAWDRPGDLPGDVEDADFGSTPLLFQPPGCPPMAAAYAKNGQLYVWRRDALASGPIWHVYAGPSDISNAFVGEPTYSPELNELVVADGRGYDEQGGITHFDAVSAFAIGPGCSLPAAPTWLTPDVGRGPKAPALLVGSLAFVVGGFDPDVYVLDAGTGAVLWTTGVAGAALAPPAFGGDQVYVGDASGGLSAIGVGPPPPPPPPPAPSPRRVVPVVGKIRFVSPRAGKPFTASTTVRSGGKPVKGQVRCVARLAGTSLPVSKRSSAPGRASCTWSIPRSAGGRWLTGSISATYKGSTARRAFAARVRQR